MLITLTGLNIQYMSLNVHSFIMSETLGPKILLVIIRFSLSPNVYSNFNIYLLQVTEILHIIFSESHEENRGN